MCVLLGTQQFYKTTSSFDHYELYILLLYVVDIDNFRFSLLAHYKLRIHFPKGAQSD